MMTSGLWAYVAVGGAIGAVSRHTLMGAVARRMDGAFPYATLAVNMLGSFLMGALVALLARSLPSHQHEIRAFVATGMLGGFTTFSTFSLDAVTLIERGQWGAAGLYALLSVLLCVAGLMLGLYSFRAVMG